MAESDVSSGSEAGHNKGGYNLEFVERLPSHVICFICGCLARDPHRMKCFHKVYCCTCLEELQRKSDECPNCESINIMSSFDQKAQQEIMKLTVHCKNASKGCTWLGALEMYNTHISSQCPKEMAKCMYYEIGCKARMIREDQAKHDIEEAAEHLTCALTTITKLKMTYTVLQNAMQEIQQTYKPRSPIAVFKMANYQSHEADNQCRYSPSFLSHPGGYKMCLRVDASGISTAEGKHMSVFVCLMQGENDANLVWPFRGKVTIELLNQLQDSKHHSGTIQFDSHEYNEGNSRVTCVVSGTGRGWPKFISHDDLHKIGSYYLKNNCLFFRISRLEVYATNKPWLSCTAVNVE